MATLSIEVCDLCNKVSKQRINHFLQIKEGKNRKGDCIKAEICVGCFDDLSSRIESEVNFDTLHNPKPPSSSSYTAPRLGKIEGIKILEDDAAIVPSQVDYDIAHNRPPENKCLHGKASFDPPYVKCNECGEEWTA